MTQWITECNTSRHLAGVLVCDIGMIGSLCKGICCNLIFYFLVNLNKKYVIILYILCLKALNEGSL